MYFIYLLNITGFFQINSWIAFIYTNTPKFWTSHKIIKKKKWKNYTPEKEQWQKCCNKNKDEDMISNSQMSSEKFT